jgi:hypothetical protein
METSVRQQVHPQSCYWKNHWDVKASVQKSAGKHHVQQPARDST